MSATVWLIIAIVGFSLSGIALITAVFMFIKLNVPAIIGDLTGKTVAREIKAMRTKNTLSGDKIHKSSRVNIDRGKLTERADDDIDSNMVGITESGHSNASKNAKVEHIKIARDKTDATTESLSSSVGEVEISDNKSTEILLENQSTSVLGDANRTAVLSQSKATEVLSEVKQTEVLSDNESDMQVSVGTTVLSDTIGMTQPTKRSVTFEVTRSEVIIHSDEVV